MEDHEDAPMASDALAAPLSFSRNVVLATQLSAQVAMHDEEGEKGGTTLVSNILHRRRTAGASRLVRGIQFSKGGLVDHTDSKEDERGDHTGEETTAVEEPTHVDDPVEQVEESCQEEVRSTNGTDFPIYGVKDEILKSVNGSLVTLVSAETGSGKSTQIPQIVLDNYRALVPVVEDSYVPGIVVTQPRRVAAIECAERIAKERNQRIGHEIGYHVRFNREMSSSTSLKFITDGLLIRELEIIKEKKDRKHSEGATLEDCLTEYCDVLIIDEAHERSLYTDIILGFVKSLLDRPHQKKHPKFKCLILSATLEKEVFGSHFKSAPYITCPGRTFPVRLTYSPPMYTKGTGQNSKLVSQTRLLSSSARIEAVVRAAVELHMRSDWDSTKSTHPPHILCFLTGREECDKCVVEAQRMLDEVSGMSGRPIPPLEIYPLYGSLDVSKQRKAFEEVPKGTRKIVFATNVAETSVTIPGIGVVIDSGMTKQKTVNAESGLESLVVVPCSKAEAIQRTGRAGRTQAGRCFRLYDAEFFKKMTEFKKPEICRLNLASAALQLLMLGIPDISKFPFITPPPAELLQAAIKRLWLLDAVDDNKCITNEGKLLTMFPLKPENAKVLCEAYRVGGSRLLSTVNQLLGVLSQETEVFYHPPKWDTQGRREAKKAHLSFMHPAGDVLTTLKVVNALRRNDNSRQFAIDNYLNWNAIRTSRTITNQLESLADDMISQGKLHRSESLRREMESDLDLLDLPSNTSKDVLAELEIVWCLCRAYYMQSGRPLGGSGTSYITSLDNIRVSPDIRSALSAMFSFDSEDLVDEQIEDDMYGEDEYRIIEMSGRGLARDGRSLNIGGGRTVSELRKHSTLEWGSWILYNELVGNRLTASTGVIRGVTRIHEPWLTRSGLLEKIKVMQSIDGIGKFEDDRPTRKERKDYAKELFKSRPGKVEEDDEKLVAEPVQPTLHQTPEDKAAEAKKRYLERAAQREADKKARKK